MHAATEIFRALADPTRLAVFERLSGGEAAVKDLTARFHVSQPAISQHLASLRSAGLVTVRRQGRIAYYRITPGGLAPLVDWLEHYQTFWNQKLDRLKNVLSEMKK